MCWTQQSVHPGHPKLSNAGNILKQSLMTKNIVQTHTLHRSMTDKHQTDRSRSVEEKIKTVNQIRENSEKHPIIRETLTRNKLIHHKKPLRQPKISCRKTPRSFISLAEIQVDKYGLRKPCLRHRRLEHGSSTPKQNYRP